jgi:hypothetical protein
MHGSARYLGAITHTPTNSPLRAQFKKEFKLLPDIAALGQQRPAPMTDDLALSIGQYVAGQRAVLNKSNFKKLKSQQPFHDVDAFSKRFPGWGKLKRTVVDPSHEIWNFTKDTGHLLGNTKNKNMQWTKSAREEEAKIGRFLDDKVRWFSVLSLLSAVYCRFVLTCCRFVNYF